jgi:tetratricopeptide (TPR) repeat protein
LDALWYERFAEAASSEGQDHNLTISLYHQAIKKPNPSWRCYRGLGITYRLQGSIAEAITQFEIALDRAMQEKADPKPEENDIMRMHVLIGQCAYENHDLSQAIKHFTALCEGQDLELVTVGQLGCLKATFKRDDANGIIQLLKDTFARNNEQRMIALAKAMARDYEDDFLVLSMVRVARSDPELLHRIVRAIEVTTATIAPSTVQDPESPAADDQYAEEEARGVLLLARGVAAYELRVSNESTDPTEEALRFWAECRDQLKKVGGQNASLARRHATSALANYYFQEMMDKGPHQEHMDTLIKMWNDDSDQENNACAGFLAALHVKNNNKTKAREFLAQTVKQALQILSDDLPENDVLGFSYMFVGMANYQDFENAAIALSLRSTPDIVSSALRFSAQDFPNFNHEEEQRLLDKIATMAEDIIKTTIIQVPDSSEQGLRLQAATAYFESLVSTAESMEELRANSNESNPNTTDHNTERPPTENADADDIQFQLIRDRLSKCKLEDHIMFERWVTCDGRNSDRKPCRRNNSKNELFHCVYCADVDFCRECLTRLRDPASDTTGTCHPKHQWLLMPPTGDKMYVGPNAQSVRRPIVKPEEEDRQVLMVSYADEAETISVEAWKEELAKEWDVSLEELKGNISKLSEPESSE